MKIIKTKHKTNNEAMPVFIYVLCRRKGMAIWTYKLISKKRNLLFFVPKTDCFKLRIVLGEKASAFAETDNELPNEIKEAIRAATPYAEGRSVDIDLERRGQLETIKRLLKIKYEN